MWNFILGYVFHVQSRVGPVQWLKPYTDEVLVELGQKGIKSLLAVPVRYGLFINYKWMNCYRLLILIPCMFIILGGPIIAYNLNYS